MARFNRLKLTYPVFALAVRAGMSLWIEVSSTDAFAFSKRTDSVADSQIRRLLRLMDKDKDGTVSKNEFIAFMRERFDRLDVNGDRRLEPDELQAFKIPNWIIEQKKIVIRKVPSSEGRRSR